MSQRPGKTSLIELPNGRLTLQTEVLGGPLRATTIVDFRGRVVRRITRHWTPADARDVHSFVRACHDAVDEAVRASLAAMGAGATETPVDEPTAAVLFVMAAEALAAGDRESADSLLQAVRALLPDDGRVARLLRSLQDNDPRRETHW